MNPVSAARSLVEAGLRTTLRGAARRRWAGVSASVFAATIHRPPGIAAASAAQRRVLVLPRAAALQDVADVADASDQVTFVAPWHGAMKALASAYLPPEVDSNTYHVDAGPQVAAAKAAYRAFLSDLWQALRRKARIDAVLTSNFSYYSERELAAALNELGVPFIVLQKENLKTPGRVQFFERLYRTRRGPFVGRRMLVYNEIERDLQIAAGVVPPERIAVVGMPRMDRLHRWRMSPAAADLRRPTVVFFDFDETNGLPAVTRKATEGGFEAFDPALEGMAWRTLCSTTRAAVVRLARDHPSLRVVIKTKGRVRSDRSLAAHLGTEQMPANLELAFGGDPLQLLTAATVVCGFNSTALLEGIAAGVPVVVPHFAEAMEIRYQPYLLDLGAAARLAAGGDELSDLLARTATESTAVRALSAAAVGALQHWTGNADGQAGARAAAEILAVTAG